MISVGANAERRVVPNVERGRSFLERDGGMVDGFAFVVVGENWM